MTVDAALRLLAEIGASGWLVRHHELVVEAARELLDGLPGLAVDRSRVLAGAALHDVGKVVVPEEQRAPGHRHEEAGRRLLIERGVDPEIARFCVTHAVWSEDATIEDLLVALADKLWKGRREEALEALAIGRTGLPWWEVDALFERIADGGDERLTRAG